MTYAGRRDKVVNLLFPCLLCLKCQVFYLLMTMIIPHIKKIIESLLKENA